MTSAIGQRRKMPERCLESMTEEEAGRLDVVAGYVDFDFPSTGDILSEIPVPGFR